MITHRSGSRHARAQHRVRSSRQNAADLFWDVRAWHEIWSGVDSIDIIYDDGVHQEFTMTVYRGGVKETVRTVRYRRPDGDIEFFTPQCPPGMSQHSGSWTFTDVPGRPDECDIAAIREYTLRRGDESLDRYEQHCINYQTSFTGRLHAILASFGEHFAHQPGSNDKTGSYRCDASVLAPVSAAKISQYLQVTENLPQWAGFFTGVDGSVGDRVRMNTVLGSTVLTRVEHPYEGLFVISSLTRKGEERALVTVHPLGDQSVLKFTMWMTYDLISARFDSVTSAVDHQRGILSGELRKLAIAADAAEIRTLERAEV